MNSAKFNNINLGWFFMKVPFILSWFLSVWVALFIVDSITIKLGVCQWVDCDFFLYQASKYLLLFSAFVFSLFYLLEFKMLMATLALSLLSLLVFSMHESFGIRDRTGGLTLIIVVQFFAYFLNYREGNTVKLHSRRVLYSIQVIVACYTLSGLSKLVDTGWSWFLKSDLLSLQVLSSYMNAAISNGSLVLTDAQQEKLDLIMAYPLIISAGMLGTMILETFAFISLISKRWQLIWGVGLLAMHVGIYLIMDIKIGAFWIPLTIFFFNPLYYIGNVVLSFFKK